MAADAPGLLLHIHIYIYVFLHVNQKGNSKFFPQTGTSIPLILIYPCRLFLLSTEGFKVQQCLVLLVSCVSKHKLQLPPLYTKF